MAKKSPVVKPAPPHADTATIVAYCMGLTVVTIAAYARVFGHEFLLYDDPLYVTQNATVLNGVSWNGIKAAFTEVAPSNWQPITILSHQLDVSIFHLYAGGHHAVNVFFHVINAILLMLALKSLTGELAKSAFVAALFALHPCHVESVAWIAERKDVLSTFFLFLALLAYVRYVRSRNAANYALIAILFALGLMAKSMLVTLPALLLVLDFWPLKRIDFDRPGWRRDAVALIREKIPLFALAFVFSIIAVIAQRVGGSLESLDARPLYDRVANALVSYAQYALGVIWPFPLAVYFPYPDSLPLWKVGLASAFLALVTVFAVRQRNARPYLLAGWLWFLGTLVPVIGIIQVGAQAMANRYTYITTIGIFIMLAWGLAPHLTARHPRSAIAFAMIALSLCFGATWNYTKAWANTETLFAHTLKVTENNYPAHIILGLALADKGDLVAATSNFEAATRIEPLASEGWINLGSAYLFQQEYARAAEAYAKAIEIDPGDATVHLRLGEAFAKLGQTEAAETQFKKVLEIVPNHPDAAAFLQALSSNPTG